MSSKRSLFTVVVDHMNSLSPSLLVVSRPLPCDFIVPLIWPTNLFSHLLNLVLMTCFGQQNEMETDKCASTKLRLQETCLFLLVLHFRLIARTKGMPVLSGNLRRRMRDMWSKAKSNPKQPKLDLTSPQTQKRAQLRSKEPCRCRAKVHHQRYPEPRWLAATVSWQ